MTIRARAAALAAAWCCAGLAGQSQPTPDEALHALEAGNRRFAANETLEQPVGEGLRRTLSTGQSPFAIVVTCSDSSVPPEHVFDAGLGDLFVVRVAGNVLDPESLASIEYAAQELGAPLCVVLAHSHCGAIRAAAEGRQLSPAMSRLYERIEPALVRARRDGLEGAALLQRTARENAHETAAECMRRSPVLRELVRLRRLRIRAADYDGATGVVEWLPDRPPSLPLRLNTRQTSGVVPGMPPHVALAMLRAGHRRFLSGAGPTEQLDRERREQLLHGQRPTAVVLTCADSRVAPEYVFDAGLGDLYVVRVSGNVVSDEALASVEYAISETGASLVVIMGHRHCGTLAEAAEEPEPSRLTASMIELRRRLEPAVEQARREGLHGNALLERAEELNVLRAVADVRTRSALARQLEHEGRLAVVPVMYELDSGELSWLKDEGPAEGPSEPPAAATETPHGSPDLAASEPKAAWGHGDHTRPDLPSVAFDEPPSWDGAETSPAPPGGATPPRRAAAALIGNLLIAFMVATAGVAVLLLVQRRRAAREAVEEA